MASCSGNSCSRTRSTTQLIQNSSSEEDLQQLVLDERKRKRMQSNRESARRSRMRKQKHLDDMMAQVAQLRRENSQILSTINITTQQYLNVESENSVLRAQVVELSQRLDSLDDILSMMNSFNGSGVVGAGSQLQYVAAAAADSASAADSSCYSLMGNYNSPWNMNTSYLNQPIMASAADIFRC